MSSDAKTYQPYAGKLRDFIKTLQPDAEIVMHQTWAYRSDSKSFGFTDQKAKVRAKTGLEMWQHSRAAYQSVSQESGLRLIPVGDAFQSVNSDPKWTYQKDTKFDFEKPIHPLLPLQTGSLNVGYSWKTPTNFAFDSKSWPAPRQTEEKPAKPG